MRLTKYNGREITIFPKPGKTVQWQRFITARYITIVKSDKEKIKERIKTTALLVPETNCHDQRNEKHRATNLTSLVCISYNSSSSKAR